MDLRAFAMAVLRHWPCGCSTSRRTFDVFVVRSRTTAEGKENAK